MASPNRLPSGRRPGGDGNPRDRPMSMFEGTISDAACSHNLSTELYTPQRAKRRSLLPQFSRKVSSDERAGADAALEDVENGLRGPSTDGTGRSGFLELSDASRAIDEVKISPQIRRPGPAAAIPPRLTSQSSRHRPSGSSGKTTFKEHIGEEDETEAARALSLAALMGTASMVSNNQESGLKRAGSTRLPQSSRAGAPAIPSRTTSSRIHVSHVRAPSSITAGVSTATTGENTATGTGPRPPSMHASGPSRTLENGPSGLSKRASMLSRPRPMSQIREPHTTSPPRVPIISRPRPDSQMLPPSKPNFSTYQQHYSPAKSALPKPPIPAAKVPATSGTSAAEATVSFDVVKQQIELLQLSMLHQSSYKCLDAYTSSAKRKLNAMHTKLREDYSNIRASELVQQRNVNLAALDSWCPDQALLIENLQILSMVHSDLTGLIEQGSRHADVVNIFELWVAEAEDRRTGDFLEPLPSDWKSAYSSLSLKLRAIQRNLRVLPSLHPHSTPENEQVGLHIVLKSCKSLVEDMLRELDMMLKLEKMVLDRERLDIEKQVQDLSLQGLGANAAWSPVWQRAA